MKKIRWLLWFSVIAFVWLVISRITEIEKLASTLMTGRWKWVLVAAVLQLLYYYAYSALYQAAFLAVEVSSRVNQLVPVMFASVFMNVAAPLAGTSGSALFVEDARRRGESPARAAAGTLLVLVADFGAFLLILAAGLIYLFVIHDLKLYEVIAAVLLLLVVGGLSLALFLGTWRPDLLQRIFSWTQRTANRLGALIHRPALLPAGWAEKNADDFTGAALASAAHPARLVNTLAIAFITHLIDLLSLLALFLAFGQAASLGVLVAGYAMGVLFWIVSITPQGIGVVEGAMTLVFTSLGVPAERAAIIALTFRGLSFWIPLLIGFILLQRLRMFHPEPRTVTRPSLSRPWGLRIVATLIALMGLVNVFSAVTPSLPERFALLRSLSPLAVLHGGRFTAAVAGFALLLLSGGLLRRKRAAWLLTELVLVISAFSHILKGLDFEEASLALGLAIWLGFLRSSYHARSDPPSLRQGLMVLGAAAIFTLFYGVAGFYLLDNQFRINFSLADAFRQTAAMFVQFSDPGLEPITGLGRYFADSIYGISLVAFGYAAIMIIRPVLVRQPATPAQYTRATQLVHQYGCTSLAAFALLPDKSYFFSANGSLIQYTVKGRIALTLGDPIGPASDLPAAVREFMHFCSHNDWLPAFYQVQPDGLPVYQAQGMQELCIGQEAIVRLDRFTLEGRENKGLRSAYNKLVRLGYRAQVLNPPHSPELLAELHEISDAWLTMVSGIEKRFSLGWFDEAYLNRCPVAIVEGADGQRLAFANILSEFQNNEASIDLMRHRPEVENGVMDYLFVVLFNWAREQGCATFNLGLSALAGLGETSQDPSVERALHYIYEHINRFYNFKGLHAYKEKFHPDWSPRYMIYPDLLNLAFVALALIRADSGDDWLGSYFKS